MLHSLQFLLGLFEEGGQLPWVADVAITFEGDSDLDGTVSPYVSSNAPVERVLEVSSVERLDIRLVRLREGRCGGSFGAGCACVAQQWCDEHNVLCMCVCECEEKAAEAAMEMSAEDESETPMSTRCASQVAKS